MELENIQNWIYEIRCYKVMLDFHLAELYQVETKRLKEAVRRNIERFPDDFMFEMTKREWEILRSQIASSSWGGSRYQPFAFTEQGVAMLSSVLNSKPAIAANIRIMRAFVMVRQLVANPPVDKVSELQNEVRELKQHLEDIFADYNDINEDTRLQLERINETLAELQMKNKETAFGDSQLDKPRNPIGFTAPQYQQR